ncbi:ABC transporter permease [Rhizobium sp. L1K21]|uniref:ABC transporter permease n=1 Tax=Rhizobium sp. L1K21 TaxID=2954933 RepID=UPI00209372CC|nr:ABC transporter permease [Rhizobium sp. L1K21]MCO6187287.1 ABC transporter permease [Rhizobium sp. L1K21]
MEYFDTVIVVLQSTVRLSVPLILTALAGLYAERSGVVDIGLEGKLLAAAFAGASAAAVLGNAWLGAAVAVMASMALAAVHGYASITQRGDQIVSGTALNFIAAGATVILGQAWFRQGGRTPALIGDARFGTWELPFADAVKDVPILGGIYSNLLSGHYLLTYIAFIMVPVSWWILFRTRFGLRLRAVGENPGAVDTAGISVVRLRYSAVLIGGILCGLAGAYLSIAMNAGFVKGMSAGKGFIALAALVFAKWKPRNILFACLLFGFLDALSIRMQGVALPLVGKVPVQVYQALPYVLTVILLAGFIGKAIPPKASGRPYVKER